MCAYDRVALVRGTDDQWESTGVAEYRLEDGRHVEADEGEAMRVARSDLVLTRA